jgi:hypothetical protein
MGGGGRFSDILSFHTGRSDPLWFLVASCVPCSLAASSSAVHAMARGHVFSRDVCVAIALNPAPTAAAAALATHHAPAMAIAYQRAAAGNSDATVLGLHVSINGWMEIVNSLSPNTVISTLNGVSRATL